MSSGRALSDWASDETTSRSDWNAFSDSRPVIASIRRVPAATPLSETIAKSPMSPVARTCVPPQSSTLKPGTETTRTWSPYFFAEERHRASSDGFLRWLHDGLNGGVLQDVLVDDLLDVEQLFAGQRVEMDEIESQAIGRHERSRLLHVWPEHLAKRRVEQVSGRVVAARRLAARLRRLPRSRGAPTVMSPVWTRHVCARTPLPDTSMSLTLALKPKSLRSVPMSETWPPLWR